MATAFSHFVVLDFEATCDAEQPPSPQEIIEFPSVLLSAQTLEVVDAFESFVRPTHHPQLSAFCTELTGIEQADVDGARPFREVLSAHQAWLGSHGLPVEAASAPLPYAFITCGDWDFRTMFPAQLAAARPPFDHVSHAYRQWINIKVAYRKWAPDGKSAGMARILEALDLVLEGRHHRGIDDCRNIVKIVRALSERGQALEITAQLPVSRYPSIEIVLRRGDEERTVRLKRRALKTLLGLSSGAFRAQAKQVFLEDDGTPLDRDEALFDLRAGTVVRVH